MRFVLIKLKIRTEILSKYAVTHERCNELLSLHNIYSDLFH